MLRKLHLPSILLFGLSATVGADTWEGGPPLGDPWKGFPLGSKVTIREEFTEGGKPHRDPTVTQFSLNRIGADGDVEAHFKTTCNGKEVRSGRLIHMPGGDPDDLGLKLAETKNSSLNVGADEFEVTVKVWQSDAESKRLELLQKPLPEILRQGGLQGADDLVVRFTVYEATDPNVAIPYHELSLRGADMAIGPRTLKIVYEEVSGKTKTMRTQSVTDLAATKKIGDQQLSCVRIESSSEVLEGGAEEPVQNHGISYYSDLVPGHLVSEKFISGQRTRSKSVQAMSVPAAPQLPLLGELPPENKRPTIDHPAWQGFRLGTWKVDFLYNQRKASNILIVKMLVSQVLGIQDDGSLLVASKEMGNDDWEEGTAYELIGLPDQGAPEPDSISEVELELLRKNRPCREVRRTNEYANGAKLSDIRWIPKDEKTIAMLSKIGEENLKKRVEMIDLPGNPPDVSVRELAAWHSGAMVAGKVFDCVRFDKTDYLGEQKPADGFSSGYQFISNEIPGLQVAEFSSGPKDGDVMFSGCLAFGDANTPVPKPKHLQKALLPAFIEFGKKVLATGEGLPLDDPPKSDSAE